MAGVAPSQPVLGADPDPGVDDFNFSNSPQQTAVPQGESFEQPQRGGIPDAFSREEVEEANRQADQPRRQPPNTVRQDDGARPPFLSRAREPKSDDVATFPPDLLRHAGMSEQDALARFGSPEVLEEAIAFHDRQMIHGAGQGSPPSFVPQASGFQQPQYQGQPQGGASAYQPAPSPTAPVQVEPYKLNLPTEQFDEDAVKAISGLNDHYHKIATAQQQESQFLRQAMATLISQNLAADNERYYGEFDEAMNGLGDEYKELFGQGTLGDMNRGSREFQNRGHVDWAVKEYQRNRQQRGMPPLRLKDAIQRVVRAEFPKQHETAVRNKFTSNAKRRQGQFTHSPTGRRASGGGNPIENVASGIEKIFERAGLSAVPETPDEVF